MCYRVVKGGKGVVVWGCRGAGKECFYKPLALSLVYYYSLEAIGGVVSLIELEVKE